MHTVIVDFGSSKDTTSALGTATCSGAFKGTFAYSAPEVYLGSREVTKATDVFALGVIFYEVNCFKNMPCQQILKMPFPSVNIIATHWFTVLIGNVAWCYHTLLYIEGLRIMVLDVLAYVSMSCPGGQWLFAIERN